MKSKDNGFTRPAGPSLVASAAEETRARKLEQEAANTHEAQRARGRGFGHATLGGLSLRAQKQLKDAPHSISIDPEQQPGRQDQEGGDLTMARTYHPTTALGCVIFYAKCVRGHAFSPEEVIAYGKQLGIEFSDQRAWGPIFTQAARQCWIRKSQELFSRASSNRSMRPGWIAC